MTSPRLPRLLRLIPMAAAVALLAALGAAEADGVGVPMDRPVNNLRVTVLALPHDLKIEWSYIGLSANCTPLFQVQRRPVGGGDWTTLYEGSNRYQLDTSFTFGEQYDYRVRVTFDQGDPDPMSGNWIYASGEPWKVIRVTPINDLCQSAQTVDSRWDLRYANLYLDFPFGSLGSGGIYRGGLFAGYAADASRVGRSFIRFLLPPLSAGEGVWIAGFHANYLRSFAYGTTNVALRQVDPIWDALTLKWTTQPALDASFGSLPMVYDEQGSGAGWKRWDIVDPVSTAMATDGWLGLALVSTNEAAGGWTYFAKKEYDAAIGPRMLVAYGSPIELFEMVLSQQYPTGGTQITGTVSLTATAPAGGKVVSLSSSDPEVASVPATVTIPAGKSSATFTITTYAVFEETFVWFQAALDSDYAGAYCWVEPSW